MGKLRLDFDDLMVESFSTGGERVGIGTVHGRAADSTKPNCDLTWEACYYSEQPSCGVAGGSCWDESCGGAAVGTCTGCNSEICATEGGCVASEGCVSADGQC